MNEAKIVRIRENLSTTVTFHGSLNQQWCHWKLSLLSMQAKNPDIAVLACRIPITASAAQCS